MTTYKIKKGKTKIPQSKEATFVKWLKTQNLASLAKTQGSRYSCPLAKFYKAKSVGQTGITNFHIYRVLSMSQEILDRETQLWEKIFIRGFDKSLNPQEFLENYLIKNMCAFRIYTHENPREFLKNYLKKKAPRSIDIGKQND